MLNTKPFTHALTKLQGHDKQKHQNTTDPPRQKKHQQATMGTNEALLWSIRVWQNCSRGMRNCLAKWCHDCGNNSQMNSQTTQFSVLLRQARNYRPIVCVFFSFSLSSRTFTVTERQDWATQSSYFCSFITTNLNSDIFKTSPHYMLQMKCINIPNWLRTSKNITMHGNQALL